MDYQTGFPKLGHLILLVFFSEWILLAGRDCNILCSSGGATQGVWKQVTVMVKLGKVIADVPGEGQKA